jgi:hypothetical protein
MLPPSLLVLSSGWGLMDLPLRASNEGSPRPRVARAQKIISLHPLFFSILLGDDAADQVIESRIGNFDLDEFPCSGRSIVDIHDTIDFRSQPFMTSFEQ